MSHKADRLRRKALLLSEIQQQRLDLTAARRDWLDATRTYDRGWNTVMHLRTWVLAGSSVMAVWSVRHPRFLVRWAKRGLGLWSAWRLVKSALDQLR